MYKLAGTAGHSVKSELKKKKSSINLFTADCKSIRVKLWIDRLKYLQASLHCHDVAKMVNCSRNQQYVPQMYLIMFNTNAFAIYIYIYIYDFVMLYVS